MFKHAEHKFCSRLYTVNKYINNDTVQRKHHQKPWVKRDIRTKLKARTTAFDSGGRLTSTAARYDLWKSTKNAKRNYRDKVESNHWLWSGLHCITDYKSNNVTAEPTATIPNEINTSFAWFHLINTRDVTISGVGVTIIVRRNIMVSRFSRLSTLAFFVFIKCLFTYCLT